ncbi:MFS transporter [Amycolatopsis rhizosphaerae]|uniref:MFS transporter n=1 Tax=Amycolatopsis rhizosphaerae TaxID=2053003 RepID=A0A558DNN2_9PSEU|nr:MFS transporter [Amycolatopsis rhizosphaerae]TVT62635.1 MFS transporter [Amycolatopsis rhizosphaerae]
MSAATSRPVRTPETWAGRTRGDRYDDTLPAVVRGDLMRGGRLRHELMVTWIYLAIMAASALPTPLYSIYRQRLGLAALDITVLYACYALVVLATLLRFGFLSDRIGRLPVLYLAVLLAASGEAVLLMPPSLPGLYVSRVLTGIAVGLAISALPAHLADLAGDDHVGRATTLGVAANMGGQALGTFLAGWLNELTHSVLAAPYAVGLLLLTPVILVPMARVPETVLPSRLAGQHQEKRIPVRLRTAYRATAATMVAAFAMFGFLTAMTGQILQQLMHVANTSVSGIATAVLFTTGAVGQLLAGRITSARNPAVTVIPLPLAASLLSAAAFLGSLPIFALAVVVCGIGGGLCLRAGSTRLLARSPAETRAHMSSRLFAALYLGASIPTIATGLLATTLNIVASIFGLALLVVTLSAAAAVLLAKLPAAELMHADTVVLPVVRHWTDAATVQFFVAPVPPARRKPETRHGRQRVK